MQKNFRQKFLWIAIWTLFFLIAVILFFSVFLPILITAAVIEILPAFLGIFAGLITGKYPKWAGWRLTQIWFWFCVCIIAKIAFEILWQDERWRAILGFLFTKH